MCGLGIVVTAHSNETPFLQSAVSSPCSSSETSFPCSPTPASEFDLELQRRLCQRGPDQYQKVIRHIFTRPNRQGTRRGYSIAMHSAVLHLRGEKVIPQPLIDLDDNILCWNGEVFGVNGPEMDDPRILWQDSDTVLVSKKLQNAGKKLTELNTHRVSERDPVVDVLQSLHGPFAVAWLHEKSKRLYFGHDRYGRRSLVYQACNDKSESVHLLAKLAGTTRTALLGSDLTSFVLSNVAINLSRRDQTQYQEVPASGIYVLDMQTMEQNLPYRLEFYPYVPLVPKIPGKIRLVSETLVDSYGVTFSFPFGAQSAEVNDKEDATALLISARELFLTLSNAVGVRVRTIPLQNSAHGISPVARVAVLFSGGLDSVVLAALCHFHACVNEPIDLLTVCFDGKSGFASPDRQAAKTAHAELCRLFPQRQWNLVKINVPQTELTSVQGEILTLMAPCDTHMDFNIGAAFYFLSRGRGELQTSADNSLPTTQGEWNNNLDTEPAHLRLLTTKVAALGLFDLHSLPPDSLMCPVNHCGRKRKLGCVLGVCKSCCVKLHRVVSKLFSSDDNRMNHHVDHREAQQCRNQINAMGLRCDSHLKELIKLLTLEQPDIWCRVHQTRQIPTIQQTSPLEPNSKSGLMYESKARVVLVGIGADEQLAGYGRHRKTLINRGEAALRAELQMDLDRIWIRNLGRDDRCIAVHGREARFPYLDDHVVSAIASFPVSSLCHADLPRGVGEKRALRLVAEALGLSSCVRLAKRAIQFGTRIAKVSSNGSNRQILGTMKFRPECRNT
ncbi:hypothetical protein CCR75_008080 [Bremia lactucae]|uniref:Glutamine amidotransferase type-2 domain-containing protein n=1 Tax=Bremia lactucae TaxID=4779 RepID=A0A976ILL5_BRELC|nr:hypothetical protein CCR75_008080 [Bremia lactucae]